MSPTKLVFLAQTPDGKRHEWVLEPDREYQVGRSEGKSREGFLAVEGDPHLSRQHFRLRAQSQSLQVQRLPGSRNPLFWGGQDCDSFELSPGQIFTTGKSQFGLRRHEPTGQGTLFGLSRDRARLRRLEDCFAAVTRVLEGLRNNPTGAAPWMPAFGVIQELLPSLEQVAFVDVQGQTYQVLDQAPPGKTFFSLDLMRQALEQNSTLTWLQSPLADTDEGCTVSPIRNWQVVAPIRGLESSAYTLVARGQDNLEAQELEEMAAILDVVADLVGHHLIVSQAAEYSNLLGVFGHHVGTLFKTSGALRLWSDPKQSEEVKQVLDNLLPIWGVSQAISLHKKQGDRQSAGLPNDWVQAGSGSIEEVKESLESLVGYVYGSGPEQPFLPWIVNGAPLFPGSRRGLRSLPPLADNAMIFDKTLALTIGLVEMLSNLRKYPEARGSGREDRRELAELREDERRVEILCEADSEVAWVEIRQPVVTTGRGEIPRSRSLDRIRALESRLLGGLVETGSPFMRQTTSLDHVVRIGQRWSYHWGRLLRPSS